MSVVLLWNWRLSEKDFFSKISLDQGSPTFLKQRATSCVPINAKGYYSLIHISEVKILLNLPSIVLVLIFVNVKTLIMLILFLEQASGRPAWFLRATWCPWAPRWWSLVYTFGCTCFTYIALNICFFIISNLARRCFFLNFQYWFTVASTANFVHFVWRTGVWRDGYELQYGALNLFLFIFPSIIFFWKNIPLSVARFICKLKCFTDS